MSQMNWNYIAGFFDGEGYVFIPADGRGCVRVEFAQSLPQTHVLLEIQEFLEARGISTKFYLYGTKGSLKVFKHESAMAILEQLSKRTVIKRSRVDEALALLKSRPRRTDQLCKRGHPWTGNSYIGPNGIRQCRACKTELMRHYRKGGG
jgi:hypothetical protein